MKTDNTPTRCLDSTLMGSDTPTNLYNSHYDYVEQHGKQFSDMLGVEDVTGYLTAHGDKFYGMRRELNAAGIPDGTIALLYLLSFTTAYKDTVRQTTGGWWYPVDSWMLDTYCSNADVRAACDALPVYVNKYQQDNS